LQNLIRRRSETLLSLGDRDEQEGTQRCPDLYTHAVGRGAEESAQPRVLLDPPPKQFDAPPAAVNLRGEQRFDPEAIGEENERLAVLRIDRADSPQRIGKVLAALGFLTWATETRFSTAFW
jgi:hypothetical protein